ncbi:MAG: class I SAM-dependent RNA methyltransferase [Verrucomicrobia bacterium]|nr:class I SAM-dependent RNA methyltransferase [Verrucomicrobiota bacterium]
MRPSQPRPLSFPSIGLEVRDVAFGGAGVAKHDGKIVFVPFTIDGERVEAEIIERRKSFDRAQLRKVIVHSPQRVNPICPYFGRCGGCDYQHITYPHQLELKRRQVVQLLERIGRIFDVEVLPTLGSASPYAFRNRITVHGGQGRIGFFGKNTRELVDVEHCAIAVPAVNDALTELRATGLADGKHRTLRGAGIPRTFAQTNDFVARMLLDFVGKQAVGDVLVDAYCGSGFFGHALSERFKKVFGIDWSEPAIKSARETARSNETYICGGVADKIESLLLNEHPHTVILDPSAEGVDERVKKALLINPSGRLIYVSCNPATLARDLARLRGAYHVAAVQPFDMFPQTAKIEAVAVLDQQTM